MEKNSGEKREEKTISGEKLGGKKKVSWDKSKWRKKQVEKM